MAANMGGLGGMSGGKRGPGGRNGSGGEKPKDRKYVFARLWNYLYRYKWLMLLAFALTVISNLLGLVGPMLSGYAIDAIHGVGDVDFKGVFINAALMIIFYAISSALSYVLSRIMINLSQKIIFRMRTERYLKRILTNICRFIT